MIHWLNQISPKKKVAKGAKGELHIGTVGMWSALHTLSKQQS